MTYEELQKFGYSLTDKQIAQRQRQILREYNLALKEINRLVSESYSRFLAGVPKENFYNEMLKFSRLKGLEQSISKEYVNMFNRNAKIISDSSKLSVSETFYFQQYAMDWIAPTPFTILPEKVIEYSVFGNPEALKEIRNKALKDQLKNITPKSGLTLKEILLNRRQGDLRKVLSTINQGIITGSSITNMRKQLTKVLGFSKSNAERILRTETHRNMMSGQYLQFETAKAKGVDAYREILSVKDVRTRQQSASVDGKKDTGEGFLYPDGNRYFVPGNTGNPAWDINDREDVISVVSGKKPSVERARNPVTGENEIISATSFDEWAKTNGLSYNKSGRLVKK